MSINKVMLQGNIGNDLTLQYDKKDREYVRIRLAENEWVKPKDGSAGQTRTNWHTVFVNGALATNAIKSLKKGDVVFFEGVLRETESEEEGKSKIIFIVNKFTRVAKSPRPTDEELSKDIDNEMF
jgi:single-strand DNA-binding protein